MFENFRERLQSVQQDFTSGIKTLSDKSKEAKVKKMQRKDEYLPQYSAGLELLNRYEETWVTLHKRTKECAKAAEGAPNVFIHRGNEHFSARFHPKFVILNL